jgi:hypothetical protein
MQSAWLTISEYFGQIEQPKMADQYKPKWRMEQAESIELQGLTDDDLKKSFQLGMVIGGFSGTRLMIEEECPASTPQHILQWLRNKDKPQAEELVVEEKEVEQAEKSSGLVRLNEAMVMLRNAFGECVDEGVDMDWDEPTKGSGRYLLSPVNGKWELGEDEGYEMKITFKKVKVNVKQVADGLGLEVLS